MNIFLDSSSFVKLFISEPGSELVENRYINAKEVFISALCYPETISAFSRLVRENKCSRVQFENLRDSFIEELKNISLISISHSIVLEASNLLELTYLRTLDAIHIAQAKKIRPDLFVTSDKKQYEAARKVNLEVEYI